MKERLLALRPVLIRAVGYPIFFMFWFVSFVYLTFPYGRLREAVIAAVEAPQPATPGSVSTVSRELSIGSLGPTFLPGIQARDITLVERRTGEGAAAERPITTRLTRVRVRVGVFALLSGNLQLDVELEGFGGTIEADVRTAFLGPQPGLRDLVMELRRIHAAELPPLAAMVGLPVRGTLDGRVELHLPTGTWNARPGACGSRWTICASVTGTRSFRFRRSEA